MPEARNISRRDFLTRSAIAGVSLPVISAMTVSVAQTKPATQTKPADKTGDAGKDWNGYQIGCFTRPWGQYDYPIALDAIAEAGFKYAGLMTCKGGIAVSAATSPEAAHRAGEEVKKRGLTLTCIYGGDFSVHESLLAGINTLRKQIDNCVAADSPSIMVAGTADRKLFKDYYKAVSECCDYAKNKNVAIVLKPHGGTNATGPQCRKCIEAVNHPNFSLWYDPGNIFFYSDGKLNPADDASTVNGIVTGMCVKDFLPAENKDVPKKVDVTPSTGKVNFPAVIARLRNGEFTHGPMLVETLTIRPDLTGMLAEAKKAREYVENVVRGLRRNRADSRPAL